VIVDFHTHIFPPVIAADRAGYLESDSTFAAMYADPKATLASAEDLLASMDEAAVDVSVALGFAWRDIETCRLHNDYLLEAASKSNNRIVALCSLPLASGVDVVEAEARRCIAAGARGFGELRPDDLGFEMAGPDGHDLARIALELDALLLFHVTEPVGHPYPGKEGLSLSVFYNFICSHPEAKTIGAHWGGGLPFYDSMPEVRQALSQTYVDTAASSLLYGDGVYARVVDQIGASNILFGSDYPLLSQARSRRRIDEAGLSEAHHDAILGANAAKLLGLS
jgi:predicted TIM-barrel fold metal-dependent hydrolase